MNPAAFAIPAAYTFGNLGRNTLIGPGFFQMDFGGYKNFRLTERIGMQFRAEIFNITNRVNFGNPNSDLNSSSFGQISGTVRCSSRGTVWSQGDLLTGAA